MTTSRFSRRNVALLDPYVPGYQPAPGEKVIKLNTNENPYPPSPRVAETLRDITADSLRLYPNPVSKNLREKIAEVYEVGADQVFCGNGADEIISLIFRTFTDEHDPVLFPYPTYSLYKTCAEIGNVRYKYVDTDGGFRIHLEEFLEFPSKLAMLANPNAPTGILLPMTEIEGFLQNYRGLLIVDETYIDFAEGEESVYRLVDTFDNLLVLRTFSKAFSLCGIRVGYAFGHQGLISDLDKTKDSYNIGYLNQLAAISALEDYVYMAANARRIIKERERLKGELELLGFSVVPSRANFVFASHRTLAAGGIYRELLAKGILVRHFDDRRISNFIRISVGTAEQMGELIAALRAIIEG